MSDIQIDMFEVQLGAAILLQFKTADGPVRVLADAGIKASGYGPEHVRDRLRPILDASGGRRIDLVIGTHYDEDHLNGLVPIIDDLTITIGEAWMPPVANDTVPHALDAAISDADLLPHQFYGDAGEGHLADYLVAKRADCETLLVLEGRHKTEQSLRALRSTILEGDGRQLLDFDQDRYFRAQLPELAEDDCDHGISQEVEAHPDVEAAIQRAKRTEWYDDMRLPDGPFVQNLDSQLAMAREMREQRPEVGDAQALSLANIRSAAAKDAINARALHAAMQALRRRNVPIRSEIIADGTPRRYAWRKSERRFVAGSLPSDGPELTLLGPSRGLVRKHWDRLPVADAARVALSFVSEIKSITPSNQLSYIARIGFSGQGILISGDAGCVDFKPGRGDYFPELLNAMLPLHVVQIAHHAGNNAHFYRVLAAAKFPEQRDRSLLLLSHATNDRTRPSKEFREFLLGTLTQGDDVSLLFTSRPTRDKVVDYLAAVHPVVGAAGSVGDVRVVFDGRRWEVKAHAVSP